MGRASSNYERELKELLQGTPSSIERYSRLLPPSERAALAQALESPFLVVRAAGSLGFDLVALRSEIAFPLEVKASSSDTIRFSAASGRAGEQFAAHRKAIDRVGLVVVYAFRRLRYHAGDPWRLYAAGNPVHPGLLALMRRKLPPVETTKDGNGVLRWESGMPLVKFLDIVSFLIRPPSEVDP